MVLLLDPGGKRFLVRLAEEATLHHHQGAVRPGGWVAAYTPSILQASQFVDALRANGKYVQIETNEVLLRGWHIQGQAVRPEHEMVGHTGFVTVARLVAP